MTTPPFVLIIGAGRIGQAFSYILRDSASMIEMCDSDEGKCPDQKPLSETAPAADIIFLCTQSFAVRELLGQLRPFLKPTATIITVAKGIERGSLKTMDEVVAESLPGFTRWGIIIGPMLAEEITQGLGSAGIVASPDVAVFETLRAVIAPNDLLLEYSTDVRGVALCGVLKNIYALGLGIGDGLGWGANRKGWLVTRAIHEMRSIITLLGGSSDTADGPAGLGDLIATGTSPFSRNRATGDQIVKTGEVNPLSEGAISAASLRELLNDRTSEFEFLSIILSVVLDKRPAADAYSALLRT